MEVRVKHWSEWLFTQIGMTILAAGMLSLVFNYIWRFTIDRTANSSAFYGVTIALGFLLFVALRREYIFIIRYVFASSDIEVKTIFGVRKKFSLENYKFVPALHKTINFPEQTASLSFNIEDRRSGHVIRNFPWSGFSAEDFRKVSQFYGYNGEMDF